MIDGLDDLLESKGQPGLQELRALVLELLGGPEADGRLIDEQKLLRSRVYRLRFEIDGNVRSLVAKRFSPDRARREQLVVRRWLPVVGMSQNGPPLLGTAAERTGQYIWHVYEDLGDWTLDKGDPDDRRVRAAVELIAQIHTRFARHALLGECRASGGDLGIYFYTSCVRDAIRSLEALCSPSVDLSANQQALRDRLIDRMHKLLDEQPHRAQAMAEYGGPETLLHGDLWTTNILVLSTANGLKVRLIDWDHAGVGPISYDLSTFLLRFPVHDRRWILICYQEAVRHLDWCWPALSDLNLLFDTAECARLANSIIWPAIAASEGQAEWAFDDLASIDQWFNVLEPVIPMSETSEMSPK
jgi:hypothetical protein